jgi:hypothetical protein
MGEIRITMRRVKRLAGASASDALHNYSGNLNALYADVQALDALHAHTLSPL